METLTEPGEKRMIQIEMNKKPVGRDWYCDSVRILFRTLLSYLGDFYGFKFKSVKREGYRDTSVEKIKTAKYEGGNSDEDSGI